MSEETRFEAVAEEAFRNYARHWRPLKRKVNRDYMRHTYASIAIGHGEM